MKSGSRSDGSTPHGGLPQAWRGGAGATLGSQSHQYKAEPPKTAPPRTGWSGMRPPVERSIVAAATVILVFFAGIGGWAALAPLESAAVAPGQVTVASHRKTVQHLEGGIIGDLLVDEGDEVVAGEVLLRLDETKARATVSRLRARLDLLLATRARIVAERDDVETVDFPDELLGRADAPDVIDILDGQLSIFEARREAEQGRIDILDQRVKQLRKEIEALDAQVTAQERQRDLIRKEETTVGNLVKKGLAEMPRLLALQRTHASIIGNLGEQEAMIARAEQRIGETRLEILDLRNAFRSEVVKELDTIQADIVDTAEQLMAAEDVLERTAVISPQAGKVVNLRVHTTGGVIAPGEALLDIVPQDDTLVVEARIDPLDIDVVRVGLPAQVSLTSYKSRHTLPLQGTVSHVSADVFADERTGAPYYRARIALDEAQQVGLAQLEMYPGMPAQVMIVTGKRTGLDYAIQPLAESFSRAFREE